METKMIFFLLIILSENASSQTNDQCSGSCQLLNLNHNIRRINCEINKNLNQTNLNCDNLIKNAETISNVMIFCTESNKLNQKIRLNTANYDFEELFFANLNEIHLDLNPFALKKSTINSISFFYSQFNFFINGSQIASESDCNSKVFNNRPSIFKGFSRFQLGVLTLTTKICPLVFHKVKFEDFSITDQENIDNIQFMNVNDSVVAIDIERLIFDRITTLSIRTAFLNVSIFYNTKKIVIVNSQIESIESRAIGSLPKLAEMNFGDLSFEEFYLNHTIFFMNPKDRNDLQLKTFDEKYMKENTFVFSFGKSSILDELATDFCDYKDYPHDKCVLTLPDYQHIKCSNCLHLFVFLFNFVVPWPMNKLYSCEHYT